MQNIVYKTYLQPAFVVCAAVLAVAGFAMPAAIKSLNVHLEKTPLPLRKALHLLDENALAPYKVVAKDSIGNEQVIKALGTEHYIQWTLEDLSVDADSAVRDCSLFITYYERGDHVPHVPEECYIGVGFQRLGAGEPVKFRLSRQNPERTVPGRYVLFSGASSAQWWSDAKFPIVYLFNVNGAYAAGREEVRFIINKTFGAYSYYSKVEWKFFNRRLGQMVYPAKEQAVRASERLLAVILPVLEKEHWPVWPVVHAGQ
ncbi:MAG: hypothetical protein ACYTBJ_07575 [Planctomycetota bacterium]|jgi:hypothetical protein